MRLDALKRRPLGLLAGLGALVGLSLGLALAPEVPADADRPDEAAWVLPPIGGTVRGNENEFALLRQSPVWRSLAETNARNAPTWKIVGVTAKGDQRVALIQMQGRKELIRVGNGDALPGDGRVLEVGRFGMRINMFGCDMILRLYTPGQHSPTPSCPPAPVPAVPVNAPAPNPAAAPARPAPSTDSSAVRPARPAANPLMRAAGPRPAPPSNR